MKTTALILLTTISIAHAHLVDLTPGGYNADEGLPPAYFQLVEQTFFDEAAHGLRDGLGFVDGWISQYGLINGGTFFDTDLFGRDTLSASISWNMAGAPDGFWMTMIYVWGRDSTGKPWENIYQVTADERFFGEGTVTVHADTNIWGIGFYGSNVVPDTGSTLALAGIVYAIGLVVAAVRKFP